MRSRVSSLITLWYRLTHPLYASFWRWVQPVTVGVKVIAVNPDHQVLLVKTRYHHWLTLPGGGVHRRETPEHAASRELREETRILVDPEALSFAGLFLNVNEGKSDYIAVFTVSIADGILPKPGVEIAEARWVDMDALPEQASPATRRRLSEWREGRRMSGMW